MAFKHFARAGTLAALTLAPSLAMAGGTDTIGSLPGPGIIGLVALGVVGAIVIARSRK